MYEHVGNPLSSEASECTRLRFYTWARPVVCQQRKSGHRGLQPPQGLPSGTGPAPHVHFPGGRLCREALKSGHRGASDPVVRDTAEGLGPEGLPSGIRPAALCRGPLPTMRYTFALRQAGPTLIRGEGFPDLFRRFLAAF